MDPQTRAELMALDPELLDRRIEMYRAYALTEDVREHPDVCVAAMLHLSEHLAVRDARHAQLHLPF